MRHFDHPSIIVAALLLILMGRAHADTAMGIKCSVNDPSTNNLNLRAAKPNNSRGWVDAKYLHCGNSDTVQAGEGAAAAREDDHKGHVWLVQTSAPNEATTVNFITKSLKNRVITGETTMGCMLCEGSWVSKFVVEYEKPYFTMRLEWISKVIDFNTPDEDIVLSNKLQIATIRVDFRNKLLVNLNDWGDQTATIEFVCPVECIEEVLEVRDRHSGSIIERHTFQQRHIDRFIPLSFSLTSTDRRRMVNSFKNLRRFQENMPVHIFD
ncbi:hypothetical protein NKH75_07205 [Mesorhizobium sp. M0984]|uniref:hypothetical protein n=1 Tax=Mesorhizobium sp. M0984 TaxID=2957041 RepID=UPI0033353F41